MSKLHFAIVFWAVSQWRILDIILFIRCLASRKRKIIESEFSCERDSDRVARPISVVARFEFDSHIYARNKSGTTTDTLESSLSCAMPSRHLNAENEKKICSIFVVRRIWVGVSRLCSLYASHVSLRGTHFTTNTWMKRPTDHAVASNVHLFIYRSAEVASIKQNAMLPLPMLRVG